MSTNERDILKDLEEIRHPARSIEDDLAAIRTSGPPRRARATRATEAAGGGIGGLATGTLGHTAPADTPEQRAATDALRRNRRRRATLGTAPGEQEASARVLESFATRDQPRRPRGLRANIQAALAQGGKTREQMVREAEADFAERAGVTGTATPRAGSVGRAFVEEGERARNLPNRTRRFLGQGVQGMTLGYGDEFAGAVTPGMDAEDFARRIAPVDETDVGLAVLAQLAGAGTFIGGQNAVARGLARTLGAESRAGRVLGAVGRPGALGGMTEGLLYDLAYDLPEDASPADRVKYALIGVGAGGTLGGALNLTRPLHRRGGRWLRSGDEIPERAPVQEEAPETALDTPETPADGFRRANPARPLSEYPTRDLEGFRARMEEMRATAPGEDLEHDIALLSREIEARRAGGQVESEAPPAVAPAREPETPVSVASGAEAPVSFADGGQARARYRLMEADELRPSHDPVTFAPRQDYPAGVQGRDYHRDRAAQEQVAARTLAFDPERLLDRTALAASGPPLVTPDGIVAAGNERTMLRLRLAEQNPQAREAYVRALEERAADFGLSLEQVRGMREPVLVRELADVDASDPEVLRALNTRSDESVGKAKDALSDAATRARSLRGGAALRHFADTFGADDTLSDYLAGPQGRAFVDELVRDGAIPRAEQARYRDVRTGALNEDGRALVRRMVLLSAIPDTGIVEAAPAAVLAKLEGGLPAVLRASATEGWDLGPALRDALSVHVEAKSRGVKVRDLLDTEEMFPVQRHPAAAGLALLLDGAKKAEVTDALRRYAEAARGAGETAGMGSLFGDAPATPGAALARVLERMLRPVRNQIGAVGDIGRGEPTVRVYHRTSPEVAGQIRRTGRFVSREAGSPVYVSNKIDGQAVGYGDEVVALDVPERLLELDDEFPGGELHYRVPASAIRREYLAPPGTGGDIGGIPSDIAPTILRTLAASGLGAAIGGATEGDPAGGALAGAAIAGVAPAALRRRGNPLEGTRVVGPDGSPRTVYHGTAAGFQDFSRVPENEANALLYGPGYYWTENPELAGTYAREGTYEQAERMRAGVEKARQWLANPPADSDLDPAAVRDWLQLEEAQLANLERLPPAGPNIRVARLAIRNPFDVDRPADPQEAARLLPGVTLPEGATNGDVYRLLARNLKGKGPANKRLRKAGYDGITHMGGGTPETGPHRVWIAFDRAQINDAFGAAKPRGALGLDERGAVGDLDDLGRMTPEEVIRATRESGRAEFRDPRTIDLFGEEPAPPAPARTRLPGAQGDLFRPVDNEIGAVGDLSRLPKRRAHGFGTPSFYSRLDRALTEFPQERATADQWAAFLAQRTAKGEREWTGVDSFLAAAKAEGRPVTRGELRALYDDNAIRLEEVTLTGAKRDNMARSTGAGLRRAEAEERIGQIDAELAPLQAQFQADTERLVQRGRAVGVYDNERGIGPWDVPAERLPESLRGEFTEWSAARRRVAELTEAREAALREYQAAQDEALTAAEAPVQTKYEKYTLPGAEPGSYREVLVKLSRREGLAPPVADDGTLENFALRPGEPTAWRERSAFRTDHWEEPDVLLHLRLNDRTLPNGERVLFVEELQSDWHQKGRREGYAPRRSELPPGWMVEDEGRGLWTVRDAAGNQRSVGGTREEAVERGWSRGGSVPDAPFKRTEEWLGLGMKRVLDEAAAGGYDRVAWTTGAQQAERYDLSKQVSRIVYDPDNRELEAFGPDGTGVLYQSDVAPERLQDFIGKDAAERLMKAEPQPRTRIGGWRRVHELSGADLKVGGEGMAAFYDRMIPNWLRDYAKKLGVRLEVEPVRATTQAPKTDYEAALSGEPAGTLATVTPSIEGNPSFRVTPELREAVRRGQPLGFATAPVLAGVAGAGTGALLDPEHPLRGMLEGLAVTAGAMGGARWAVRRGSLLSFARRVRTAEERGTLATLLRDFGDEDLAAWASRLESARRPEAAVLARELEERAVRASLPPLEAAEREVAELVRGPLRTGNPDAPRINPERVRDELVREWDAGSPEKRALLAERLERSMEAAQERGDRVQARNFRSLLFSLEGRGYQPSPRADVAQYVNLRSFNLDPGGEARLSEQVRRMVEEEGLDPKERVTWAETAREARELGLGVLDVAQEGRTLTRVELLALRDVVRENVEGIRALTDDLARATSDTQRASIVAEIEAAERQNMALLSRFTRDRSEAGRTLNSFKILANSSMDYASWYARVERIRAARGLTMTPEVAAELRRIIDSCG